MNRTTNYRRRKRFWSRHPWVLSSLNPKAFESETVRVPHSTAPTPLSIDNSLPDSSLFPAEAMAHASHHILTEQYFADAADECEAERARIEKRLNDNPLTDKTISGRMLIANLLNPVLVPYGPGMRPIPTFINVGTPVSRTDLVAQRTRHCAGTNVHSEATRQPQTDVSYLDGKFSLNHAAHQLKEAVEQSEGLRTETAFQKGRYRRWIVAGKPIEWVVGCKLDVALSDMKGIDSLNILSLESFVIMRSAKRIYLGQVKGIYRYGSVSGKHESFTDAETVEGLSYLSLKVYEQMFGQNVFKHISICKGPELALFTHAPISALVYHLSGAGVKIHLDGTYSISAGDAGWERWAILRAQESRDILYPKVKDNREEVEEGGKKRRPKGPRGAVKKQKTEVVKKAVAERKPHAGNSGSAGRAKGSVGMEKSSKNSRGIF
ncbi:hypothetical protein B0H10DRAFT_2109006 [Mycena sp. CBHHK59/15]|nr:hypothetical protein B0H10DRAFT_2109006 [Mycena sp. CBHHK59/15]